MVGLALKDKDAGWQYGGFQLAPSEPSVAAATSGASEGANFVDLGTRCAASGCTRSFARLDFRSVDT